MYRLAILILTYVPILVGCFPYGGYNHNPETKVHYPYIENIDSPQEVKAGERFAVSITLSALENPGILTEPGYLLPWIQLASATFGLMPYST